MGWRLSGGSQRPKRRIVHYGPNADAVAADVADDLAYYGAQIHVDRADDPDLVLGIRRRDGGWEFLLPGRQLVLGVEGGWRIELASAPAVAS